MRSDRFPVGTHYIDRNCIHCGTPFLARHVAHQFCTRACQARAWRAVAMLDGRYGRVNGQFGRLKRPGSPES
jgi:hypothetical protein